MLNMRLDDRWIVTRHAIDECPYCGSECCNGSCQFDEIDAEGDETDAEELASYTLGYMQYVNKRRKESDDAINL